MVGGEGAYQATVPRDDSVPANLSAQNGQDLQSMGPQLLRHERLLPWICIAGRWSRVEDQNFSKTPESGLKIVGSQRQ